MKISLKQGSHSDNKTSKEYGGLCHYSNGPQISASSRRLYITATYNALKRWGRGRMNGICYKNKLEQKWCSVFYILYHKILHFGIQISQTRIFHLLSSPQSATAMQSPECTLQVKAPAVEVATQPCEGMAIPQERAQGSQQPLQCWSSCCQSCRDEQLPALFESTEVAREMLKKSKHTLAWHCANRIWYLALCFPLCPCLQLSHAVGQVRM